MEALEDADGAAVETGWGPGALSLFPKPGVDVGDTVGPAMETGPGAVSLFPKACVKEGGIVLLDTGYELLAEPKSLC